MDRLKEEQAEWEEHRRQKAQELADRTETVRRRAENPPQRVDVSAAMKQELAELRERVRELEMARSEASRALEAAEADAGLVRKQLRSAKARATGAAAALAIGLLAWLIAGWREPIGLALLAAAIALAALLVLSVGRGSDRQGT
jgi:hypothetical protein